MSEKPHKLRLDEYRARGFDYQVTRSEAACCIELINQAIHRSERLYFRSEKDMEDWNLGLNVKPANHEWKQDTQVIMFSPVTNLGAAFVNPTIQSIRQTVQKEEERDEPLKPYRLIEP